MNLTRSQVKYVEPERIYRASELVTQSDVPSWGLARTSSGEPGTTDYTYDSTAGEGIFVYGVDTGIDIEHADFEGRAEWGTNTVDSDDTDGNGHGTHTASTMAGVEFGIAKKASVISVKVLGADGSGSTAGIIEGIQWVVDDAEARGATGKAVMNLSLGGGLSQSLNDAATGAVGAGVFMAVAAGNDGADAANYSPASADDVCCVGASDDKDGAASFSNYGSVGKFYLLRSRLNRNKILINLLQSISMLLVTPSPPPSPALALIPCPVPPWPLPTSLVSLPTSWLSRVSPPRMPAPALPSSPPLPSPTLAPTPPTSSCSTVSRHKSLISRMMIPRLDWMFDACIECVY